MGLLIRSLIEDSLVEELEDRLKVEFNMAGGEAFSRAVDLAQVTWSCCGIVGPEDYNTSLWRREEREDGGLVVPLSCCILNQPQSYLSPVPKHLGKCQNVSSPAVAPTRHLEVQNVLSRYPPIISYGMKYSVQGCSSSILLWAGTQDLEVVVVALGGR